ncbi:MAG: multifunctional oxoglutarate decarboxylase/oxoglutarate dehydrogenase thiamine pyrophosphate-binding subunit/dihydrolipoyllysine-residue succinyltransferase subunit [Rhodothermales bacterium]
MSSLGYNTGYIEEIYKQFLQDPQSVSESWRDFFADYKAPESFAAAHAAREPQVLREDVVAITPAIPSGGDGAITDPIHPASVTASGREDVELKPLRGAGAKIVENMEASLGVPTATSVRQIPVRLLSENRKLINDYQRYVGGYKVSFTHIVAYAIVQGLKKFSNLNSTVTHEDGKLQHVIPKNVNFGLAIDVERRGRRTLLVPNIKAADQMTFVQLLGIYNDIVKRARDGKLGIADFQGTTATLTNPGMIGTALSVPRLMPGQGTIIGVGAIGFPPEYQAVPPDVIKKMGISEVMSITSTYDHRVIQGAESGGFLAYVSELLVGKHGFYTDIFSSLKIPYQPYSLALDTTSHVGSGTDDKEMSVVRKQAGVLQLIRACRVRAHLQADVNPLGYEWAHHTELDPATYGLTIWDLDREFITGGLGGSDILPLREILEVLRETYSRKMGIEFMHISDPIEKRWLQERIEPVRASDPLPHQTKRRILQRLNAAEAFERFLHTKYIGHKRFSLEGSETMIPMIDAMLCDAADQEVKEVVIGMAHRGRLNVLANILSKPYEVIFSEFEGSIDPKTSLGSGDVKYHMGAKATHLSPSGAEIKITLASNPSHLEAVNPVVEGMVRAKQDHMRLEHAETPGGDYKDGVIPLLIHGDAAFAGQGVVAETLNLSQLKGYTIGGTIHLVINNQIGFTTNSKDARSSTYATDVARMIQAPIFHVNGDDPESCVRVMRLALDFRQVFNKDVVIDLITYRVHGHNEGDEPTYTQPLLYKKIEAKRSVRKLYTELLLRRGEMQPDEAEVMLDDYRSHLQEAFERVKALQELEKGKEIEIREAPEELEEIVEATSTSRENIDLIVEKLTKIPEEFSAHKKLLRQFDRRAGHFAEGQVDWALGEALAFGSLLLDGAVVRLVGQDSRRGTFSHRHAVLYDQENGNEYIPLNNLNSGQPPLLVYDSFLSEYAACGFEYGYSLVNPDALVIWEAQFGDFSNGAQIIFDQFLSASLTKWGQQNRLVLLLPHGYEGQGPEHSSARLERFLQLCAEKNMSVCNFTSPANYFHALRRQVKNSVGRPLVVMSPKSLLRHPAVVSSPEEFMHGELQEIIPAHTDPAQVRRHLFCSGKVYFEIMDALEKEPEKKPQIAVTRVEQFYPFADDKILAELERYSGAEDVCWVQEEPRNMGGWTFMKERLDEKLESIHGACTRLVSYKGRAARASTATGSAKVHQKEQDALISKALAI